MAALRRYVVAHQGYAARFRRATRGRRRGRDRRGSGRAARLDLDRRPRPPAHALDSRIGAFDEADVSRLLARGPHLRVLGARGLPAADRGLPALQAADGRAAPTGTGGAASGRPRGARSSARCSRASATRARCPVRAFEGRSEPMWGWKPAKRALEHLFAAGEVAIAGRQGFQRVYDLPERVIPTRAARAPAPTEDEFRRGYALRAVAGPRRADRGRDRRALPLRRRREGGPAARRRARRTTGSCGASRSTTAAPPVVVARRRRARRRAGARPSSSARSTT